MQNLDENVIHIKYQTIFLQKKDLKSIIKHDNKKLLTHYLQIIEYRTREGFFKKGSFSVPKVEFIGINKNAFKGLNSDHADLGTLGITRGTHNQVKYILPETYPKTMQEWGSIKGGYLKIDRDELLSLVRELSDNELRVYFSLLLISEANSNPETGIETWYKTLRDNQVNLTQNTLKKCLKSLCEMGVISLAEPICAKSRFLNRFIFCVKKISRKSVSKKMRASFHKIDSETSQNPQNCVHLKENISKKEINLNQRQGAKSNQETKQSKIDFDFCGLDNLKNPMNKISVNSVKKHSNLADDQIQRSVRMFSKYMNSGVWNTEIRNPVAFLCHHMKTIGEFVPPECFYEFERQERRKESESLGDFDIAELSSYVNQELAEIDSKRDLVRDLSETKPNPEIQKEIIESLNLSNQTASRKVSSDEISACFSKMLEGLAV